jgi:S1-C subfamily serine protease
MAQGDQDRLVRRQPSSVGWLWFAVLALVVGEILLWFNWAGRTAPAIVPDEQPRPVVARASLDNEEKTIIGIFKQTSPSVVYITTLSESPARFSSFSPQEVVEGTGSGVVWDRAGHIVTNAHVIEGAQEAQVTLADRSSWKAHIVGAFLGGDLAVVSIDAPPERLQPLNIGTSSDLEVGQTVLAIGNPFGLDHTLTTGVISALNRQTSSKEGRPINGLIQTDAPINPGNSGGPLLDSSGRMIGLNSAIISPSGASAGVGFAIPVDDVNRVVTQLIQTGEVNLPSLGLVLAPHVVSEELGLPGVLVLDVLPGGPAANAGIRPTTRDMLGGINFGDVILALDGKKVDSISQYYKILDTYKIGDTVEVTLGRDHRQESVKMKLEAAK